MLKRTVFTALAAAATLAFAASANAAYLSLGTTNTSNTPTTLTGNPAAAELLVKNTNGASTNAVGLYGLLTATAPTAGAPAVRGANSSTNAYGYGVWGSQAGSGVGVYGYTPSGRGLYGLTSSGTGVYGQSTSGLGVYGRHASTSGSSAGVQGLTSSNDTKGAGVRGVNTVTTGFGTGYGVWGSHAGSGGGVLGTASGGFGIGLLGVSPNFEGVRASLEAPGTFTYPSSGYIVAVDGEGHNIGGGILGQSGQFPGVSGYSGSGYGVYGSSSSNAGVYASNSSGNTGAVFGESFGGDAIRGISHATNFAGIYGENATGATNAGYFAGHVQVNGGCTGCAGASLLQIDDPLDPAHKYLQHASVVSSQQLDVYSGNVTTNAKGFATVTMPRWFQALNRSFRYQLTSLSGLQQVAIAKEMHDNRFTVQSQRPHSKVSWQVSAVRHDRYAKANPTRVIVPKSKTDQGKYVQPEVYGKPRSFGIGYQKPLKAPRRLARVHKR